MLGNFQRLNSRRICKVNKCLMAAISTVLFFVLILLSAVIYNHFDTGNMANETVSLDFLAKTTLEKLDGTGNTFIAGELWKEKACVIMAVRRAG